ncbi:MAG: DUF808 family protein [Flavobacteriales bacterium]
MASGFFALFDDVATLLDDVAAMSKITTKKTAGILGDDLAVNAEKASGFASSRELPILWKITKGSFLNKVIILPLAFLLSAFLPKTIIPILLIGGVYLAFEGVEKIIEFIFHSKKKNEEKKNTTLKTEEELFEFEKKKIKSAILVDFILSIEIIILALSTVVEKSLITQIIVVSIVSIIATIGVYGIVALIVRIDDFGYQLIKKSNEKTIFFKKIGQFFVKVLPIIIRSLSVIGTIAMLLVAGGIYQHNIHFIEELFSALPILLAEFLIGLIIGILAYLLFKIIKKIIRF